MTKRKTKKKIKAPLWFVLILSAVLLFYYVMETEEPAPESNLSDELPSQLTISDSDFSIHMPELGNKFSGDCTLIKSGDIEILIDPKLQV